MPGKKYLFKNCTYFYIKFFSSFIAIRTSSGAVVLYTWKANRWREFDDLSIKLHGALEPTWNYSASFEDLKLRANQIQATGKFFNK